MPKFKNGKQVSANEAYIMSIGRSVGNLKNPVAKSTGSSATKYIYPPEGAHMKKGHGPRHTEGKVMKAKMQKKTKTGHTPLTQRTYANDDLSLGQVNTGFRTTPKGSGVVK